MCFYHRYFQISMYCAVRQTSGTHKISFSHTFLLHWVWKVTPLYAWLLLPLIFTVSLLLASPIFIHSRWEILINWNSKELFLQDIPFEAYSGKHENLTYFWMGEKTLKSFFTICKWKPQINLRRCSIIVECQFWSSIQHWGGFKQHLSLHRGLE